MMNGETPQGTIDELWPWASLRAKQSGKSIDVEILDQIYEWMAQEVKEARTGPDPALGAKALVAARRCFEVLSHNGYSQFLPLVHDMQIGIDKVKRIMLKELVRRLLRDEIPEPKAGEVMRELSGLIEAGEWSRWRQDWDEWEDEVSANLAAETAAP
jgi:hypothetical protein